MNWYGEPKTLTKVMGYANIVFTIFYTIEMVIKIIAFGKNYFKDGWNIFDFLIVIFAWIGFFAEEVFRVNIGTLTTVVRMFRILRVLKLVKRAKNLQNIL
jgi:type IV secretory pathway TrbL component